MYQKFQPEESNSANYVINIMMHLDGQQKGCDNSPTELLVFDPIFYTELQ